MLNSLNTQITYLRSDVQASSLPVGFSSQLGSNLAISVERDVVYDECALLAHGIDRQSSRTVGLWKEDVEYK